MKKLLDWSPDITIKAHGIQAIKRGEEGQCVVFLKGCGPMDGFVVEMEYETAVSEWEEALEDEES